MAGWDQLLDATSLGVSFVEVMGPSAPQSSFRRTLESSGLWAWDGALVAGAVIRAQEILGTGLVGVLLVTARLHGWRVSRVSAQHRCGGNKFLLVGIHRRERQPNLACGDPYPDGNLEQFSSGVDSTL